MAQIKIILTPLQKPKNKRKDAKSLRRKGNINILSMKLLNFGSKIRAKNRQKYLKTFAPLCLCAFALKVTFLQ